MIFFHAEPLISRFSLEKYITLLQQLWQTVLMWNLYPIFISLNQLAVKITPAESFLWMHLHQFQYLLRTMFAGFNPIITLRSNQNIFDMSCFIGKFTILIAACPCVAVSHFAPLNAPTESCRCTTRIPWYYQNPAYTHRKGLFMLPSVPFVRLFRSYVGTVPT